jgi:hypothetical protein
LQDDQAVLRAAALGLENRTDKRDYSEKCHSKEKRIDDQGQPPDAGLESKSHSNEEMFVFSHLAAFKGDTTGVRRGQVF